MSIVTTIHQSNLKTVLANLECHLKSPQIFCKYCGLNKVIMRGNRINSDKTKKRYECKFCGKSFTGDITRYGNQEVEVHDRILDLAVNSVKAKEIGEIVKKTFERNGSGVNISKATVLNTIKKDCQFLSTFEYNLCHGTYSSVWEIDETFERLRGGKTCYVFNVKAVDTKFWLVSYVSEKRTQLAQNIALTYAYERACYAPEIIRSDGFAPSLKKCIPELKKCKINSISKKQDYACINNIERINRSMHETIPKRYCVYSLEHLQSLAELRRLHYNFLQKHPTFPSATPSKIVGIDLPISNWIDLFRIADYFDRTSKHKF